MKLGWKVSRLGDVCEFARGLTYKKSDEADVSSNAVLRANNISLETGKLNFDDIKYITDDIIVPDSKKLKKNSLLVCTASGSKKHLGKIAIVDDDFDYAFGGFMGMLTPSEVVNPKYLYWLTRSNSYNDFISGLSDGANINNLKFSQLSEFQIPLPPLPEQKRIVAILDEAFAGIAQAVAHAEKNLANARELFESYLNAIFTQKGEGWVEKTLSEVCGIASNLVDPRDPEFIDLPHVGAGNMVSMTGEIVEVKTAKEEGLKSGKFIFDETMVLYSKIRPYLMKSCRPDFGGLCSADVYPLSPNVELLDRDFLFHLLMNRHFTEYAIAGSARAGMPKVNRDHLFRYRFFIPNISEQKVLVAKIDALSAETKRLEITYKQKLGELTELKQSILQKAFAGELAAEPEKLKALA